MTEKVYFDTSGFNYFLGNLQFECFLNTRELQALRDRELLVSPITIWELMLAGDDQDSDFLLFSAQNFFSKRMLAAPSEIILRYLRHSYPENSVNYGIFTELRVGRIWAKMTEDNSLKFEYDKEILTQKTNFLRRISKNISSILKYPAVVPQATDIEHIAHVVNTFYECSLEDGFFEEVSGMKYDKRAFFKLYILFVLIIFVLRLDFEPEVMESFWKEEGLTDDQPTEKLMYIMEQYPELLKRGPLLELTVMAYHQFLAGSKSRGLILDSFHAIYTPYVDTIISADADFETLKQQESHYARKLVHVSELNLHERPYVSSK
jgi:hypothetical protein